MSVPSHSLTILRSNGLKDEIVCPSLQSTTLRELKSLIQKSNLLGNIPIQQQRIFHYGRELKTLGRTLESLGIGRLVSSSAANKSDPKIVIHVHASPLAAATAHAVATQQESGTERRKVTARAQPQTARKSVGSATQQPQRQRMTARKSVSSARPPEPQRMTARKSTGVLPIDRNSGGTAQEIVDLYSDDDDDDDNDDDNINNNNNNINNTDGRNVHMGFINEDNNDDDDDEDDCVVVVPNETSASATSITAATSTSTTDISNEQSNKRHRHT